MKKYIVTTNNYLKNLIVTLKLFKYFSCMSIFSTMEKYCQPWCPLHFFSMNASNEQTCLK